MALFNSGNTTHRIELKFGQLSGWAGGTAGAAPVALTAAAPGTVFVRDLVAKENVSSGVTRTGVTMEVASHATALLLVTQETTAPSRASI